MSNLYDYAKSELEMGGAQAFSKIKIAKPIKMTALYG